jgi:dihydroneopterin aldolase
MAQGIIFLKDLSIQCIIGINEEERAAARELLVNVELTTDFFQAAMSDDITKTINYIEVGEAIKALLIERKFNLVETAAEESCKLIFSRWLAVTEISISIEKAFVYPDFPAVGVRIVRTRSSSVTLN